MLVHSHHFGLFQSQILFFVPMDSWKVRFFYSITFVLSFGCKYFPPREKVVIIFTKQWIKWTQLSYMLWVDWREFMLTTLFASAFPWLWLAGTDLGINHFTTDLILVVSFAILTALPMSFLRPTIKKWEQAGVKSSLFKK